MTRGPVRLLVSLALGGGLALLVYAALPRELDVSSDIVGYPIFANFNVDRYLWTYALITVVFPLAALGCFLILTRVVVGPQPARPMPYPLTRVEEIPVPAGRQRILVAIGRTLLVATIIGLEAAIVATGRERTAFWLTVLGYIAVVGSTAWIVARFGRIAATDVVSALNATAAPITVAGLYVVSESTEVTVAPTGAVHEFSWLPAWLAAAATAAILGWLALELVRAGGPTARSAVERRALVYVVAPVGVFLFVAALPGALGASDAFEQGQGLAGTELMRDGLFPWRDLLIAHGLLFDVANGLVGTELLENSRWGFVAGVNLLVVPLAWVALYYLCAYLVGSNWLFLLGTQLLVFTGDLFIVHTRFLLLPFVFVLLAALLRRATAGRAVAFTFLLTLQVVVTPEAMVAAAACVGTLVLFEAVYYTRGRGLRAGFRRTWLCVVSALILALAWSSFLLSFSALDDWAFSFTTMLPGHALTGGIPFQVAKSDFEVVVPVVLVPAVFAFVSARLVRRRPLAVQDWVMVALAGLTLLYYTKFLSRANEFHLDHAYSVAVPLLLYVAYRGITYAERALLRSARARGLDWFPPRHTVTGFLLLMLLLAMPVSLPEAARALPDHFTVTVPSEPTFERSGYQRPGESDATLVHDLQEGLAPHVGTSDTIFDFANAPGLFHFLLDLRPSTRYYHVSLAMRQRTQADLVRQLERDRPEVVVYTSDGALRSQFILDGVANQVRYYDVSRYLLETYVPVWESHGFVFMRRRKDVTEGERALYFRGPPCDWGYAPNFFAPTPDPGADELALSVRSLEPGRSWEVTLPESSSAYGWLEVETRTPLREGRFELSDRRAVGENPERTIAFGALDRDKTTLRVFVGACSQWHGYEPGKLHLRSSIPQDVRGVRLLR